jgi:hypothetical protein
MVTPFTISAIMYKVVWYAPAEGADTLTLFLHYPCTVCTLWARLQIIHTVLFKCISLWCLALLQTGFSSEVVISLKNIYIWDLVVRFGNSFWDHVDSGFKEHLLECLYSYLAEAESSSSRQS